MNALESPPVGGDYSRGPAIKVISLVTFAFVALCTVLRMIGRIFITKRTGWDDYTMLLALVVTDKGLSCVSTAFNVEQIKAGAGRHTYYLTLPQIFESRKYFNLAEILLAIITCMTKVSICLFLLRIPNSKRLRNLLWALILSLVLVNGTLVIVFILQCRPFKFSYNPTVKGSCWPPRVYEAIVYVQGVVSVITDLICCSLPIAVLWKVQISRRTKIAICGLIATGLFTTACSAVRTAIFTSIFNPDDSTWRTIDLEIWAIFEENLGLIAANLPVMLPIWRYLREKVPLGYSHMRSCLGQPLSPRHRSNNVAFYQIDDQGVVPMGTIRKTTDFVTNSTNSLSLHDRDWA